MNVLDAAYSTVHDHDGGAAALAPRMGMAQAILNSKVNPNTSTHHLRLDEANKLMAFTGDFRMLHALAFEHNFVCIPKPQAIPEQTNMDFLEMLLELGESKGEVCKTIKQGWADRQITRGEAIDIEEAIHQMVCKLETLRQHVRSCLNENQKQGSRK